MANAALAANSGRRSGFKVEGSGFGVQGSVGNGKCGMGNGEWFSGGACPAIVVLKLSA